MKILYVARHACGDNDDEGAIASALERLGHEVVKVHEKPRHRDEGQQYALRDVVSGYFDFCLFHKWASIGEIAEISKHVDCFFWYFDMVVPVDGDPTLMARSHTRVEWMRAVTPYVKIGFCTDGDWVDHWQERSMDGKTKRMDLSWLMQGADDRVAGFGRKGALSEVSIMFTGMINHGQKRASHIAELRATYGDRFGVLGDSGARFRKHGRELADVFANTKIVVAPDGPSTDRYWSNRIYLTTSLGGFLLHPYCSGLAEQYSQNVELVMYKSRRELEGLIDFYLKHDDYRETMRRAGYEATMSRHTYLARCAELVSRIERVL